MSLNFLKGTNAYGHLVNLYHSTNQNDAEKTIAQLPEEIRQKIFTEIWELSGRSLEYNYGEVHFLDDLNPLHQAVNCIAIEIFDSLSRSDKRSICAKAWKEAPFDLASLLEDIKYFLLGEKNDENSLEEKVKADPVSLLHSLRECFGSDDRFINKYFDFFELKLEDFGLKNGDFDSGGTWSIFENVDSQALQEAPKYVQKNMLYDDKRTPRWIKDDKADKFYLNDSPTVIRAKCLLLVFGMAPYIVAATIISMIRLIVAVSAVQLWVPNSDRSWEERVRSWKTNLARSLITPVALVQMEIAALKGVFGSCPYDARKNIAAWEKLIRLPGLTVAPCFQPSARVHFFGGDPSRRNAF